jgi:hypothetical protein
MKTDFSAQDLLLEVDQLPVKAASTGFKLNTR